MIIRYGRRKSSGDPVNGEPGPPVEAERFLEVPGPALLVLAAMGVLILAAVTYCGTRPDPMYASLARTKPAAASATTAPRTAPNLPAVAEPAPSPMDPTPSTPAAAAPASAQSPAADPPMGTCKRMRTEDPEAYKRLYDGTTIAGSGQPGYGHTYDPDAYHQVAAPWIEECMTPAPGSSTGGAVDAAGSVEAPKSFVSKVLDWIGSGFDWLTKILRGA